MQLREFEAHAVGLRNVYFFIRSERFVGKRRKWYRQAAKEKARLTGLGVDSGVLRLYALWLRAPHREHRLHRFKEAFEEAANGPRQLRLF